MKHIKNILLTAIATLALTAGTIFAAFPTDLGNYQSGDTIFASIVNNIETKIGITDSTDTDSLDYKVRHIKIPNDTFMTAKDNAGTGIIDIIKVTTADKLQLGAELIVQAMSIVNTTTDNSISVDQNGNVGTDPLTDGAIHIENTGNTGIGLGVYTDIGATADAPLVHLKAASATFDQNVFRIDNYGTKKTMHFEANGTRDADSPCFLIDDAQDTGNNSIWSSSMVVKGANSAGQTSPIFSLYSYPANAQTGIHSEFAGDGKFAYIDHNGNGMSIDIDSEATTANGIYGDFQTMTSGKALTLVVDTDVMTGKAIQVLGGSDHATDVFSVGADGSMRTNWDSITVATTQTPASNAACTTGEIAWDANYMYVCTASGVWGRSALTTGY